MKMPITLGLGFAALAFAAQPAAAQNCPDFQYQDDAQAAMEADPVRYGRLDGDNDGVACQDRPRRIDGPSGGYTGGGPMPKYWMPRYCHPTNRWGC